MTKDAETVENLEMRITLRDGRPEVVLDYSGVKVPVPMRHTYSTTVAYDVFQAVMPWIPPEILDKHAPKSGDRDCYNCGEPLGDPAIVPEVREGSAAQPPELRPKCCHCGKRWLPPEGIDAQEVPCESCRLWGNPDTARNEVESWPGWKRAAVRRALDGDKGHMAPGPGCSRPGDPYDLSKRKSTFGIEK